MGDGKLHTIFADCCAKESSRYGIDKPFVRDNMLCATNGSVLVWQPTSEANTEHGVKAIDVILSAKAVNGGEWIAVPDTEATFDQFHCARCNGTGQADECKYCGRSDECEACGGDGGIDREWVELVPGSKYGISSMYAALLKKHGVKQVRKADEKGPLYFEVGGVRGIVLPMEKQ